MREAEQTLEILSKTLICYIFLANTLKNRNVSFVLFRIFAFSELFAAFPSPTHQRVEEVWGLAGKGCEKYEKRENAQNIKKTLRVSRFWP